IECDNVILDEDYETDYETDYEMLNEIEVPDEDFFDCEMQNEEFFDDRSLDNQENDHEIPNEDFLTMKYHCLMTKCQMKRTLVMKFQMIRNLIKLLMKP